MDDSRTVWCGNIADCVTEELLYELFLQAAPLERVKIPTDRDGRRQSSFAFITLKHEISVDYVVQLLNGIQLYGKNLTIKPRQSSKSMDNNSRNLVTNVQHLMQMNPFANEFNSSNHSTITSLNNDRYRGEFNQDLRQRINYKNDPTEREYRVERDSFKKPRRNENYENGRQQRDSRKPYTNRKYEERNRRYKRYS